MPAFAFEPDPLLSRSAPRGRGAFDVLPLMAPARPVFRAEGAAAPGLAAPAAPAALAAPGAPASSALEVEGDGSRVRQVDHATASSPSIRTEGDLGASADTDEQGQGDALPSDAMDMSYTSQQVQEMLTLRYREGFEEGLAQGAQFAASSQAAGFEEPGADAGAAGIQGAVDETAQLLQSMGRALMDLHGPQASAERFEPLKRLALHLATELARAELSLSGQAIDRLIHRCVEALDARALQVVVELHPEDLALWRRRTEAIDAAAGGLEDVLRNVEFKEDAQLARGSVRARSDHACVEDLIEHRLAGLVQDLRIDAQRWQQDQAALSAQVDAGSETPDA